MKKHVFPKKFLWGASTSAHQVEGNNVNSDWWRWETSNSKNVKSGTACNHYLFFKEDFLLAKKLGHNSHRLSIEWARIEPRPGKFDKIQVKHYREVLKELKKLKIKSFVTLWHFTLPYWFADRGGFEKNVNLIFFERYVKFCVESFGDLVDFWVTVNEPTTYVLKSYIIGIWPPQNKNIFKALKVYKNIAKAHNIAFSLIKNNNKNFKVGAAHQLVSYYSKGGFFNDSLTKFYTFFVNDYFYNKTQDYHDYIGLNYYFKNPVSIKYLFKKIRPSDHENIIRNKSHHLGWNMDPSGISDCLDYLNKRFKKPIYILEHGISDPGDKIRKKIIKQALESVYKAIQKGVDVRGYLHWSLLDNFEWNLGFQSRFGLVSIDNKTFKRKPKRSAYFLKNLSKNGY